MKTDLLTAFGFVRAIMLGLLIPRLGAAAAPQTNYYHVNPGGSATDPFDTWGKAATDIQSAVDAASAAFRAGEVDCTVLVSNGTYTLTGQILITNGITLRSVNGWEATVIDGNRAVTTNRCVEIRNSTALATIDGFTICNGYAYLQPAGGGVYATNSLAAILNCRVTENQAALTAAGNGYGGGIGLIRCGTIRVANCLVVANTNVNPSSGAGVGIYAFGSKGLISDCQVISNRVVGNYGDGGGISINGSGVLASDLVVSNCTLTDNYANYGGGIYLSGGTMVRCLVSNNSSRVAGGGVTLFTSYENLVANCTITGNRSADSGGISINRGNLFNCEITRNYATGLGGGLNNSEGIVRNCLFAGNRADLRGGGVNWSAQTRQLINCTFTRNSAGISGGGLHIGVANAIITNLIVFGNQAGISNDVAGFTGAASFSCSPDLTAGGASSNITSDPLFLDNGSGYGTNAVLGDYRLQSNSPCIAAGRNLAWMTLDPVLDLEGNRRIRPAWGRVDMGAYEAYPQAGPLTTSFYFTPATGAAPMTVTFAADMSGSTNGLLHRWDFGDGTVLDGTSTGVLAHVYGPRTNAYTVILSVSNALGEMASKTFTNAIMVYPAVVYVATGGAHLPPFETWASAATNLQSAVDVAGSGYSAVLVGSGTYAVGSPVAIGKGILVMSQNGAAETFVSGLWPQTTNRCFTITGAGAILDGFTITNGYARDSEGGGVLMTAAGTIRNCVLTGNRSGGSSASGGGGISFSLGSVINCLIQNNAALTYNGGGVIHAGASCLLSNCVVIGNTANGGGGGVVQSQGLVANCIISNNVCGSIGGGLYKWTSGSGSAQNCLITANRAGASGGGVYVAGAGGIVMQNCTVADNTAATWAGGLQLMAGIIRNCIIDGNRSSWQGQENVTLSAGTFVTNCTVPLQAGAGNVTGDPAFADRGSGDYRIRGGSPAIDAANAASAPSTDLDGNGRLADGNQDGLAVPDMGAYESAEMASGDLRCSFAASTLEAFDAAAVEFTAFAEGADTQGVVYAWSFGDGSTSEWSAAARTLSHDYGVGAFPVVLSVSNAAGQSASWGAMVRVLPSTLYVSTAGAHLWPYTNWSMAATNLQAAVDAAGETASTGSWIRVASGVYTVAQPVVIVKHITLQSVSGAADTVVNGNYPATTNRCMTMNASGATVDGFTLTGGYAAGAVPDSYGGGLFVKAGTVQNCDIRFNQAANGGGGIYMEAAALRNSTVYGNVGGREINSPDGAGGVFFSGLVGSESSVSNCWIACNTNNNTGGGISGQYGLVSQCRIERNVNLLSNTGTGGGGVRINLGTLENCEVVSNYTASVGGGVHLIQHAVMRGCLVVANQAKGVGGGVNVPANSSAHQKIENCTIVGNSATNGGGIYSVVALSAATNCIVTGNWATMPGGVADIGGTVTNVAYSCSPSLTDGVRGNITADPQFVRAGSGYGTNHIPGNYRLKTGSPCNDSGAVLPWMGAGALDLEGQARIQGAGPNMGAYEKVIKISGVLLLIR